MSTEDREFPNTVIAVTGTSAGLGAAIARLPLEAGAKFRYRPVAVVLQQPHRVRTTQSQLWSMGQGS
jgi:NAD(P)-dependent dehydrogenase (short-subunit alcohol dehydrogenase family)